MSQEYFSLYKELPFLIQLVQHGSFVLPLGKYFQLSLQQMPINRQQVLVKPILVYEYLQLKALLLTTKLELVDL